jgi:hypothetical protein
MQLTTCLGFTCQHRLGVLPRREYELLTNGQRRGADHWAADRNNGPDPPAWRTILAPCQPTPLPTTLDLSKKTPCVSSPEITTGQAHAYVYFEDEPGRRAAAKLLTKDEVRRITANIAKLPGSPQ